MAKSVSSRKLPREVLTLIRETGAATPVEAVRLAAREVLDKFFAWFPNEGVPINVEALASFRSIRMTTEPPSFSEDAELVPDGQGRVHLRVNRERPYTRQRFSIGHEVGHTLFPGYAAQVQCRKPRSLDWHAPSDILEFLCDVASSEFLLPIGRFLADLEAMGMSAERLLFLADRYKVSPEATIRRFVDLAVEPTAAVFFRWKNKPAEKCRMSPGQRMLPGVDRQDPPRRLRVEYFVCNAAFEASGRHIPAHKSIGGDSAIHRASTTGMCFNESREHLDFGAFGDWFRVYAVPIFTQDPQTGPLGERNVVAVLQPARKPRSK